MDSSTQQMGMTLRSLRVLAGAFVVLLLAVYAPGVLALWTEDIKPLVTVLFLVGAIAAWVSSTRPMVAPYTAETILVAAGAMVMALFVSGQVTPGGYDTFSLAGIALIVVFWGTIETSRALAKAPMLRLAKTDDTTVGLALAGAAAILLSLYVLNWFKFTGGDELSAKFGDFVEMYRQQQDGEAAFEGVRLLFFEWGYVVSTAMGLAIGAVAVRGRTKPLPASTPVKWFALGITALMGLWQLVIVLAFGTLDEYGEVQIGAWVGVVGHALVIASTVRLASIKLARRAVAGVGAVPGE